MNLRAAKYNALLKLGVNVQKTLPNETLEAFLARFRAHYVSVDLHRYGLAEDGGYLLPDILDQITCCFSPGVSLRSDFEADISRARAIPCYLADASVDAPALADPNFSFDKKFIGNHTEGIFISLKDWVAEKVGPERDNMLLQMDIEGAEYDVLVAEDSALLRRFACIVVEFHSVNRLFDPHFFKMFSGIFEKLWRDFSICHAHPNNAAGSVLREGIEVPRFLEVTFLRNDHCARLKNGGKVSLPHPLDRQNSPGNPDLALSPLWWRSA